MKLIYIAIYFLLLINVGLPQNILPLTQRYFDTKDSLDYSRGTYLIVLGHASLKSILEDGDRGGDFIYFKKTQGYNVTVVDINDIGVDRDFLKQYLNNYYINDPLLEYVLLIGDVDGPFEIPTFYIDSYNELEEDVTDHIYTFFDNDPLSPEFFIGRWTIQTEDELRRIKAGSIGYVTLNFPGTEIPLDATGDIDFSFLNNALMVAGNYAGELEGPFPMTPVWTSKWLMDELYNYGYSQVDTAFWQDGDEDSNYIIKNKWEAGVGIVGYRGWGGPTGWDKPDFRNSDLEEINNTWKLPVVFSLVCKTGQFDCVTCGQSFAETAIIVLC